MLPDCTRSIYVNTGNLINCKELNRRAIQSPTEEAYECINFTMSSWMKKNPKIEDTEVLHCINQNRVVKVDKMERQDLKVTVKVFLHCFDVDCLTDAVFEVMRHLDVDCLDSIILALPCCGEWTIEKVQPLWGVLETFVKEGKIITLGISDLDTGQLVELYQWAQVKPSVNQVNLDSCCVMPPEMTAFAKDNDIQLLTHNDPKELLSQHVVQDIISHQLSTTSAWSTSWIVRYSVINKCRGIIQNKGYLLCARKYNPDLVNDPCLITD